MTRPTDATGESPQRLLARSQTALIQADRAFPALPAAASQRVLRAVERRNSYRWSSGSSTGGRPLGRFVASFMAGIICPYKYVDKPSERVLNARTLTRRST
jgi:hypothetical protein